MNHRTSLVSRTQAALTLALAAGLATPVVAQDRAWNTTSGSWGTATNWTPLGAPPVTASALFGVLAAAENATVTMDGSKTIAGLVINNGMTVNNDHWSLTVTGDTSIAGSNTVMVLGLPVVYPSRLHLESVDGNSLRTDDMSVTGGGRVELDNAYANVLGLFQIGAGSRLSGNGNISFSTAGVGIRNDGEIRPGSGWGIDLGPAGSADGSYDLDGSSGNGQLMLDIRGSRLKVTGTNLADTFSGQITMASESTLELWIWQGWTLDSGGAVDVNGSGAGFGPAVIDGMPATLGGRLSIVGAGAHLQFAPSVVVQPSAVVILGTNAVLDFEDQLLVHKATIGGGSFDMGSNSRVAFHGPAELNGGAFELNAQAMVTFGGATEVNGGSFDAQGLGASVHFDGATEWSGAYTMTETAPGNGLTAVNIHATVAAPAVINAPVLDMDGDDGMTIWDVSSGLVVNTNRPENTGSSFDGTFDIAGGAASRVTININTGAWWTMRGRIDLTGDLFTWYTRFAGSRMAIDGEVHLPSGKAEFDCSEVEIAADSTIDLANATSALRLKNLSTVQAGATFAGGGTLENGAAGLMILENGASLDQVRLSNQGTLQIEGAASVDRFLSGAGATWQVSIGGYSAGVEHDQLIVTSGTASLAGAIHVNLENGFVPHVGDGFTVLTALGGVNGTFLSDPVTPVGGMLYRWHVEYNAGSVVLRLQTVEPACYANCDGSTVAPILNVSDFICFVNKFAAADPYANCDQSTTAPALNVMDFHCFLNKFQVGCS